MTVAPPSAATASAPADLSRQVAVTVAFVACVVANLVGSGAIGGREVDTANNAAFADDSTLLTPAGPAFSIWSLVYLGQAAYVLLQWRRTARTDPRHRAIGWLVVAASVLNATWLWVTFDGLLWTSVVVIVVLLAVLCEILRRLGEHPPPDRVEAVVTDGTFGLYAGWVSLASVANVAATAAADGATATGVTAARIALVVLVAIAVVTALAALAWGRVAVALAQAWGLGWVAYGRFFGEPDAWSVGVVAVLAALTPLVAVAVARRRSRHHQERMTP
ncbi:hypothetical protein RDV89_11175 [Nocardioides zeae]|uniref:Tryptophan-rich sensory protein n=1 Tax=Nocardioides imazamoxiresistens TaxID=3231893 RepID=A0ABU3PXN1_9ACTN|nr:hypothetical protein [Nocardioides zeae]MDT9593631.1 hypothetical protein [Nocardioides zeae]